MKTIYSLRQSRYLLLGLAAFAATSCASYQNRSYDDRDGIYGGSGARETGSNADNAQDSPYKEYFGTLRRETEIFTSADDYTAAYDTTARQSEVAPTGYGGWGSEADNVTVNIYGNSWGMWNNWGYWNNWYGPGWGWNSWYGGPFWSIGWSNWYGPGWGWGWASPYYGWGYNNWHHGFYTPHYGNHHVYQPGRRGSSYNTGIRNSNIRQNSSGTRSHTQYSTGTRNSGFNGTRTQAPRGTRTNVGSPRTSSPPAQPRNSGVRTQSPPSRDYSSPSTGGGRSSGGFGGGGGSRSSGGGGRR